MQIMEQLQADQTPAFRRDRSALQRAMSWLSTLLIESFAASAQAMYPVCPLSDEAVEENAEPALQVPHQAESESDPVLPNGTQPSSFDDWLSMEKVSTGSFGWSARVRSRAVRLWSSGCRACQRRRAITELDALDDLTLKDIGIHRCQIKSVMRHGHFYEQQSRGLVHEWTVDGDSVPITPDQTTRTGTGMPRPVI
jgi:uncharacterized protein YjiS (DUF1127 family)